MRSTRAKIDYTSLSNIAGDAIRADDGSIAYVSSISGSGNNYVYSASGGIIMGSQGTITGTTMNYKSYGGQIFLQPPPSS